MFVVAIERYPPMYGAKAPPKPFNRHHISCELEATASRTPSASQFRVSRDNTGDMPPVTGVFPDYPARTVVRNQSTERELSMMRWGMPPPPKFGGLPLTNIRNSSSPHWGPSGGFSLDRYCHRPTVAR